MSLSVCCLTNDPGPRVAATLELLRPVADEIVVAADDRADERTLAAYTAVADRVEQVRFEFLERHLAWLHEQCSGDWVLRIDGDEVPSPALVRALPELIAAEDARQYWIPRRWLHPDEGHWIDAHPWWPDFQLRLVRREPDLRFVGRLHTSAEPLFPARYIETPLYHLETLVTGLDARRDKGLAYVGEGPDGADVSRFYVPEDHLGRAPAPVPAEDRDVVSAVLAGEVTAPAESVVPETTRAPSTRAAAAVGDRPLPGGGYRASVEPFELEHTMAAGEHRAVHFRVRNTGTVPWPPSPAAAPEISASYRWVLADGAPLQAEVHRSPLPADLHPGRSTVVPVLVTAPASAGRYELEVDLVHEQVRWFGCARRVTVDVYPAVRSTTA